MTPAQLRELASLASSAADWLDDPNHHDKPMPNDAYHGKSLILFDAILGGKYGIVLTTSKQPEAWK